MAIDILIPEHRCICINLEFGLEEIYLIPFMFVNCNSNHMPADQYFVDRLVCLHNDNQSKPITHTTLINL